MIDVKFLITAYIISVFVDWVFQSDWCASHKSKWGKDDDKVESLLSLLQHSVVYSGITSIVTIIILGTWTTITKALILFITLFVSHAIIDNRIIVRLIMKAKGMSNEQIDDHITFGFMWLGLDQRLHELILLILAIVFAHI